MNATIYIGDCTNVMAKMEEASVDTIVTDPPYHLTQMSRSGSPRMPGSGPFGRHHVGERGFMGKTWDGGGISFDVATWMQALRVAKPGAFLVCFGGTRTWHRLACAIEDAGWEIRDTLCWLFGQGFPKSHSISKAIDKVAGAKREVIAKKPAGHGPLKTGHVGSSGGGMSIGTERSPEIEVTVPATDDAKTWDGYGTCMKPAFEPIILAMKPLDGTFADNALKHGAAGLWIDGARIRALDSQLAEKYRSTQNACPRDGIIFGPDRRERSDTGLEPHPSGRWPANVVLSHSPNCVLVGAHLVKGDSREGKQGNRPSGFFGVGSESGNGKPGGPLYGDSEAEVWACVPDCPVRMLDQQGQITKSSGGGGMKVKYGNYKGRFFGGKLGFGDVGGSSRFFYCSKANVGEREKGLIGHVPCPVCGGLGTTHHVNEWGKKVKCRRNTHPTGMVVSSH